MPKTVSLLDPGTIRKLKVSEEDRGKLIEAKKKLQSKVEKPKPDPLLGKLVELIDNSNASTETIVAVLRQVIETLAKPSEVVVNVAEPAKEWHFKMKKVKSDEIKVKARRVD